MSRWPPPREYGPHNWDEAGTTGSIQDAYYWCSQCGLLAIPDGRNGFKFAIPGVPGRNERPFSLAIDCPPSEVVEQIIVKQVMES